MESLKISNLHRYVLIKFFGFKTEIRKKIWAKCEPKFEPESEWNAFDENFLKLCQLARLFSLSLSLSLFWIIEIVETFSWKYRSDWNSKGKRGGNVVWRWMSLAASRRSWQIHQDAKGAGEELVARRAKIMAPLLPPLLCPSNAPWIHLLLLDLL